jgi:hypothetical protein
MSTMLRRRVRDCFLGAGIFLAPTAATAHTLVVPYTLPVPFWMYLFACGATLVLTFAALGVAATVPVPARAGSALASSDSGLGIGWVLPRPLVEVLRLSAVFCLGLTIIGGLVGSPDPGINIGMILFWIGFLLFFNYLTVVLGNTYSFINPWRAVIEWGEAAGLPRFTGRLKYPKALAYWPAFLFYVGLIWLELMVLPVPASLSAVLIVYSVITFAGAWLFGKDAWFGRGEVFSVFFQMVGLLAVVCYERTLDGRRFRLRLRAPLSGAVEELPDHISLVLFVLFMLSSTTYDGIKDTGLWQSIYWTNLLNLLQPLWDGDLARAQALLEPGYEVYQRGGLLLSPFLYAAVYQAVMAVTRFATNGALSIKTLALNFAFSVIPIAVVYNFAHYYTVLLNIVTPLPYILSDPFGRGWNLLGLTQTTEQPPLDMGGIWNTEVAVILAGHLASVYVAHVIAVRVFPSQHIALRSEIPLLFLMVAYTFFGLFVLSLPLAIH